MIEFLTSSVKSEILGRSIRYHVLRPTVKQNASVIYLLHGLFGSADNWCELTDVRKITGNSGIVCVMPDGDDLWYVGDYERFFITEFVPIVEKRHGIGGSRMTRGVAGLSMGGFAAIRYGLRYAERFGVAGSMSGAFNATDLTADDKDGVFRDLIPSIVECFGSKGDLRRNSDNIFTLVSSCDPAVTPPLYIDCGKQDMFLEVNRKVAESFAGRGFDYDFETPEGGHDWNYWSAQLANVIRFCGSKLRLS